MRPVMRTRADGAVTIFPREGPAFGVTVAFAGISLSRVVDGNPYSFLMLSIFVINVVLAPLYLLYGTVTVSESGISGLPWLPRAMRFRWSEIGALSWEMASTSSFAVCRLNHDTPIREDVPLIVEVAAGGGPCVYAASSLDSVSHDGVTVSAVRPSA